MIDLHFKPIIVNDNDVLSGRGITINRHPGNERFRTLVKVFRDDKFCQSYSIHEKRAVAKEIMTHIHALNPPGRFLKLERMSSHGEVWSILSECKAMQKTCQALRDCNRLDRSDYATALLSPIDVKTKAERISMTGLSIKQRASAAASIEFEKKMRMTYLKRKNAQCSMMTTTLSAYSGGTHDNLRPPHQPMTSSVRMAYGIDGEHLQDHYPKSNSVLPFSTAPALYHQSTVPVTVYCPSAMLCRNEICQEVQYNTFSPTNTPYPINNNKDCNSPIKPIEAFEDLCLF